MNTIPAKTLLIKNKDDSYFGTDYNMNIYKGCCHGCIYCDSRSACYQIEDFDTVRLKENAIPILRSELSRKLKTGVIGTGAMSDPYNPFEAEQKLTRHALELINDYHFGVAIATKSDLIVRDIDVLKQIGAHSPVLCKITITTISDPLCQKLEHGAPVSSKRFEAIKKLSMAGIYTGILLMPTLPLITDTKENILGIIHQAYESGVRFIFPLFGMSLRFGQREYYYRKLNELFPRKNLVSDYIRLYGSSYECYSPNARILWEAFRKECDRLGILYQMRDITQDYKRSYQYEQLSFPI